MYKRSEKASRRRLSQPIQNLNGKTATLVIEKQGRCVSVSVERKCWPSYTLIAATLLALYINFLPDLTLTATIVVVLLYYVLTAIYEESLVMVYAVGYQLTSKTLIQQKDLFIPWNQVQSIFINEVIVRHKVIHLLSFLTKDEDGEKLIPVFVGLKPRLEHLELMCRHLKGANS